MAYSQYQNPMWQQQQPYQYQQNFIPQPQQFGQPQNQLKINNLGITEIRMANEQEATSHIVEPNQRILFVIGNKSLFCIKSADSLGNSTIEWFKYDKVDNNTNQYQKQEFDPKEFVKKEDINGFVSNEKLENTIKSISDTFTKKIDEINKKIKIQDILKEDKQNA